MGEPRLAAARPLASLPRCCVVRRAAAMVGSVRRRAGSTSATDYARWRTPAGGRRMQLTGTRLGRRLRFRRAAAKAGAACERRWPSRGRGRDDGHREPPAGKVSDDQEDAAGRRSGEPGRLNREPKALLPRGECAEGDARLGPERPENPWHQAEYRAKSDEQATYALTCIARDCQPPETSTSYRSPRNDSVAAHDASAAATQENGARECSLLDRR
jgi:hypothetical protein